MLVGVLLVGVAPVSASVPTWTYPCAAEPNPGACERLTYLAEQTDENRHRLDLAWWGTWALVGLLLILIIAPGWFRAWGFEGKLGRG